MTRRTILGSLLAFAVPSQPKPQIVRRVNISARPISDWSQAPPGATIVVLGETLTLGLRSDGVVVWEPKAATAK